MSFTREQSRKIDNQAIQDFGIPGIVLMENAGRSAAEYLLSLKIKGKVVICCGKGNNGGDGLVVARYLDNHHIPVHIILFANPNELSKDSAINYKIAKQSQIPITLIENEAEFSMCTEILASAKWIVDALFGIGLSGNIKAPFDKVIAVINASAAQVVAVDIPSGLDCDTGLPLGIAVRAHYTLTCFGLKTGFSNVLAKDFLGHVYILDLCVPRILKKNLN